MESSLSPESHGIIISNDHMQSERASKLLKLKIKNTRQDSCDGTLVVKLNCGYEVNDSCDGVLGLTDVDKEEVVDGKLDAFMLVEEVEGRACRLRFLTVDWW